MEAPALILLASGVLGVWLDEATAWSSAPWALATLLALLATALATVWERQEAIWALVAVAMGFAWLASAQPVPPALDAAPIRLAQGPVRARARIAAPLSRRCFGGRCRLSTQLQLLGLLVEGQWQPASARVAVALWELGPPPARGDDIELMVQRRTPRPTSPWTRAEQRKARALAAWPAVLEARSVHLTHRRARGIVAALDRRRLMLARAFDAQLPGPISGIVRALVLGDTGGLASSQRQRWADAGLAHLLAISGLHVGLIFALSQRACSFATARWGATGSLNAAVGRGLEVCLPLGTAWLYVALAACPIAALRAALMLSIAKLMQLCGFVAHGQQVLGVAGLLMVLAWPLAAAQPSFVLSFLAVAGLLGIGEAPLLALDTPAYPSEKKASMRLRGLVRGLVGGVRMSLVATLVTLPACIFFFGRISWVGPLANLLAVPLVALVVTPAALGGAMLLSLADGLQGCGLAAVGRAVGRLAAAGMQLLVPLLVLIDGWARWCATLGGGIFFVPPKGRLGELGLVIAFAALASWSATRLAGRWAALLLVFAAGLLACGDLQHNWASSHRAKLEVYHLDVGQGDATLLRLPHGRDILIDGGGALYADAPDPGERQVAPALLALGVQRLWGVLVTHAHPDHIGGLAHVVTRWPVDTLWRSEEAHDSRAVQHLERLVQARGGQVALPPPSLTHEGVHMRFVTALQGIDASANDHSVVMEVSLGQRRLTLLADVEQRAEADLVGKLERTDIIKVGHHGSRTSSHDALLSHLSPRLGVISCGPDNRFGFPHVQSEQRLLAHGLTLLRTDQLGTIGYATDGQSWHVLCAGGAWTHLPLMPWAEGQGQRRALQAGPRASR